MNKAMHQFSNILKETTIKGALIVTVFSLLFSCLAIPSMNVSAKEIQNDDSRRYNDGSFRQIVESQNQQDETQAPGNSPEPPAESTPVPPQGETPVPTDEPGATPTPEEPVIPTDVPVEEPTEVPVIEITNTVEPTFTTSPEAMQSPTPELSMTQPPTISQTPTASPTETPNIPPTDKFSNNKIATGFWFNCFITSEGGVKCMGNNDYGQLGNGTYESSNIPVDVVGLSSNVVKISISPYATVCALTDSGGLKCWGDNSGNEFNDGRSIPNSNVPVDIPGFTSGVKTMVTGSAYTCVITEGNGAKCWGFNEYGRLGNGTVGQGDVAGDYYSARDVVGLTNGVEDISAFLNTTCAVVLGHVKCWGANFEGQLGNGESGDGLYSSTPVDIIGLPEEVKSIHVGMWTNCAVLLDGKAKCWGEGLAGQLGNGGNSGSPVPVSIINPDGSEATDIKTISIGASNSCLITNDNVLKCWGSNADNIFGYVYVDPQRYPIEIPGWDFRVQEVSPFMDICVFTTDSLLKCWGDNNFGQLGLGSTGGFFSTPQNVVVDGVVPTLEFSETPSETVQPTETVTSTPTVTQTATATRTFTSTPSRTTTRTFTPTLSRTITNTRTITVTATRTLTRTITPTSYTPTVTPTRTITITRYTATPTITRTVTQTRISPTGTITRTITPTRTNTSTALPTRTYQTFTKTITPRNTSTPTPTITPTKTETVTPTGIPTSTKYSTPLDKFTFNKIGSGVYFNCFITTNGGVKCVGDNHYGQLGNGTYENSNVPVDVVGLSSGVIKLAGSDLGTVCALLNSGGIKCWGDNSTNQFNYGNTGTRSNIPVDIPGFTSGVKSVVTGNGYTCVITDSNGAKCWGDNSFGQLGNGTMGQGDIDTNIYSARDVIGLTSGVEEISAGEGITCAVVFGSAECWGSNSYGQLGNGDKGDGKYSTTPVNVVGLSENVKTVDVYFDSLCAVILDGRAKCWGESSNGIFGNGGTFGSSIPVALRNAEGSEISNVKTVSMGPNNACLITNSDVLNCWGSNADHIFGTENPTYLSNPTEIFGSDFKVKEVSGISRDMCVLTIDDSYKCWGSNYMSELGIGMDGDFYTSPQEVLLNILIPTLVPDTATPEFTLTNTQTITLSPTNTVTLTPSATITITPTETDTVTATYTATKTDTVTPTYTATETDTTTPTYTATETETNTPTYTATETDTVTPTNTPTPTETFTPTYTPTSTETSTPTVTQTQTYTLTPTKTITPLSGSVVVNVADTDGNPRQSAKVYVFNGTTNTGKYGYTGANGLVTINLPSGSYHFRADLNGTQFWSSAENNCVIPGCTTSSIVFTKPAVLTVKDTDGEPAVGVSVYAYDGSTYKGYSGKTSAGGQVSFTLPQGNYRFRADLNGTRFWTGVDNTCVIPGCLSDSITVTKPVTVTVKDSDNNPVEGISLYAFDGTTYKSYSGKTTANGQYSFTLPQGNYRFRADLNGTKFWSGAENTCAIPGCQSDSVAVTRPLAVAVKDTDGVPMTNLSVYAFNNATYAGYSSKTDSSGNATFTLPVGNYRFRADFNKTQFWSSTENACTVPGCTGADVTVTKPVTISVKNSDDNPMANLSVYAFDGTTYKGYSGITDTNGLITLTLPLGNYRFRVDYNGTHFWSGATNTCAVSGCVSDSVVVSKPLTFTLSSVNNNPVENIHVYAFDGTTYSGYSAITNSSGQAVFTLPFGNYRFRADTPARYWSGVVNTCTVPGCESAAISIP